MGKYKVNELKTLSNFVRKNILKNWQGQTEPKKNKCTEKHIRRNPEI